MYSERLKVEQRILEGYWRVIKTYISIKLTYQGNVLYRKLCYQYLDQNIGDLHRMGED